MNYRIVIGNRKVGFQYKSKLDGKWVYESIYEIRKDGMMYENFLWHLKYLSDLKWFFTGTAIDKDENIKF